ncbi:hypothetical protein PNOK_0962000 [Pyrrhoderma noxium]|uniref:DUF6533 domain-containing protein n=1 Tax=Pyrrhoderma noxium TaxID=2282107 RepID=A0A286U682_9AGAM|nr:hypothetical protein PNOK_0962000 [Pyrrhoderma noxium]
MCTTLTSICSSNRMRGYLTEARRIGREQDKKGTCTGLCVVELLVRIRASRSLSAFIAYRKYLPISLLVRVFVKQVEQLGVAVEVSMASTAELSELIVVLQDVKILSYIGAGTLALLVFDWFLTIDEEISLVWPSGWALPKILYFLNRYPVFVDPILLIYTLGYGSDSNICVTLFRIEGAFTAFGFITAQIILGMRTWAIWERRLGITVYIVSTFLAALFVDLFFLVKYLRGVSYLTTNPLGGCLLQFDNRIVFVCFCVVIFTETSMLLLLVLKAHQHFQISKSTLMVRMFNDGVVYFSYILLTSIANLVTILVAPISLHIMFIIIQRAFHSIFCSRVLLHIRGAFTNRHFSPVNGNNNNNSFTTHSQSDMGGYGMTVTMTSSIGGSAVGGERRQQTSAVYFRRPISTIIIDDEEEFEEGGEGGYKGFGYGKGYGDVGVDNKGGGLSPGGMGMMTTSTRASEIETTKMFMDEERGEVFELVDVHRRNRGRGANDRSPTNTSNKEEDVDDRIDGVRGGDSFWDGRDRGGPWKAPSDWESGMGVGLERRRDDRF